VDEVERNDESMIYVVEMEKGKLSRLRMYPTRIDQCQANLAGTYDAKRIAVKMEALCREMETHAQWQEGEGCLEVALA
jgi:hypothetical protein